MTEWFVGRRRPDFYLRINYERLDELILRRSLVPAVDITVVSSDARIAPEDADLVLQYKAPRSLVRKFTTQHRCRSRLPR